jgi:hypothetical protein
MGSEPFFIDPVYAIFAIAACLVLAIALLHGHDLRRKW